MFCCPACFSDENLQDEILAEAQKKGKCSFCKKNNQPLINPEELVDRFEPFMDLYETDQKGSIISELIQKDWNVFAFSGPRLKQKLLKLILGNEDLLKKNIEQNF